MAIANLFGLSTPIDIDIHLNGQEERKLIEAKVDKDRKEKFPLYFDGETVAGKINIRVRDGKKVEHNGIKVEFVGSIVKEQDLWVHSYVMPADGNNSIKMEVGIEDCLHIEFEYNKS
ncbi:hypothetical protein BGZ54_009980, partial [Gamsiella multidivaricata]